MTPQDRGRAAERTVARAEGARVVPMSGAGRIKADLVGHGTRYEVKYTEAKSYQLSSMELETLRRQAVVDGSDPIFVICFADGIRAEVHVSRWR